MNALERRFWLKVDISSDATACWPWNAARMDKGYGKTDWGHQTTAHRVAYFLAFGDDPVGRVVCHACDNPPCCNPFHLWLGSHADNMLDMDAKRRRRGTPGLPFNARPTPKNPRAWAVDCAQRSAAGLLARTP